MGRSEIEDGMGFSGLVPSKQERREEKQLAENRRLRAEVERLKKYLIREVARRKRLLHDCVGPDFNYTRGGVDALQAVRKFIDSEEE